MQNQTVRLSHIDQRDSQLTDILITECWHGRG